MATALFMKMVVEMTEAQNDQEHIEMIIYNWPRIPDRTGYILGKSAESPAPAMIEVGRRLVEQGAELIAVPCVTAGYFYEELAEGIQAPVINIINEVGSCLARHGIRRAGLLATSGTVSGGLFQDALAAAGCSLILPGEKDQSDLMHVIYENVKANRPVERHLFDRVAGHMRDDGAQVILLGCTELSVVRESCDIGSGYLDVMRLLAKCAVEQCGRLKAEYAEIMGRVRV